MSYTLGKKSVKIEEVPTISLSALLTSIPEKESASPTPVVAATSSSQVKAQNISATPFPTQYLRTTILTSNDGLTGFRSSNNQGAGNTDIKVGRNEDGVYRGFVSFELSLLPAGVNIKEAKLRLYQKEVVGRPYSAGGALKIDHLNYGNTLDDPDYAMAALLSGFSIISTTTKIDWVEVDVSDQVKDDIKNARPRSQYRLHFTIEQKGGTSEGDIAYFESLGQGSMAPFSPQLVVKY